MQVTGGGGQVDVVGGLHQAICQGGRFKGAHQHAALEGNQQQEKDERQAQGLQAFGADELNEGQQPQQQGRNEKGVAKAEEGGFEEPEGDACIGGQQGESQRFQMISRFDGRGCV